MVLCLQLLLLRSPEDLLYNLKRGKEPAYPRISQPSHVQLHLQICGRTSYHVLHEIIMLHGCKLLNGKCKDRTSLSYMPQACVLAANSLKCVRF